MTQTTKDIGLASLRPQSSWLCAPLLLLGLSGCPLAAGAEQGLITESSRDAGPTGESTEAASAKIVSYEAKGELCPGSAEDWQVIGSSFKLSTRKLEPSSSAQHVSCKLNFLVQVTAGQRFGNPLINYDGFTIGHAHLITNYAFKDGQNFGPVSRYLVAKGGAFTEIFSDFWSPACDPATASRVVDFTVDLQASVAANEGFELANISGDFGDPSTVSWLHCGETPKAVAAGAAEGEPCSLLPTKPCREGLTCDLVDDETSPDAKLNDGACVDPSRQLAPQEKGQNCGGVRGVSCASGLVCHYTSAARAAEHAVGSCTASTAIEDQPCGGSPMIACAPGLHCAAGSQLERGQYCQRAAGKQGDPCGTGLADCGTGLSCHAGACAPVSTPSSSGQPPTSVAMPSSGQTPTSAAAPMTTKPSTQPAQPTTVKQGQACGGASNIACLTPLICDPNKLVCVAAKQPGKAGATCVSSSDCESGLLCIGVSCAKPITNAGAGAVCRSTVDCQGGLTCSSDRCVDTADLGEPCDQPDQCGAGLTCAQQFCVVDEFEGSAGAPCVDASDCDPGLACLSSQCAVSGSTGSTTVLSP